MQPVMRIQDLSAAEAVLVASIPAPKVQTAAMPFAVAVAAGPVVGVAAHHLDRVVTAV